MIAALSGVRRSTPLWYLPSESHSRAQLRTRKRAAASPQAGLVGVAKFDAPGAKRGHNAPTADTTVSDQRFRSVRDHVPLPVDQG
jgi:hypothetical protein